ncbi:hypothetical protein D3C84_888990 [compost metagenome]
MRCPFAVLVQQVQIGTGAVINEQRAELATGYVPLDVLVVIQVAGRVVSQVAIDVFRGLLPTDAETLHQMPCGQTPFPQCDGFNQSVTQRQIPTNTGHSLLALHVGHPAQKVYLFM